MLVQFRDPRLSLWQSSLDQVLHQGTTTAVSPPWTPRTSIDEKTFAGDLMREATRHCKAVLGTLQTSKVWEALHDLALRLNLTSVNSVSDCSSAYLKLAAAVLNNDRAAEATYRAELTRFGNCDPRYVEAMNNYVDYYKLAHKPIPYRNWSAISDYVEELPESCTIALIGDWGTGQEPAKTVLQCVATHKPGIVIHLGDIYYSGTRYEADNYFMSLVRLVFGATMPKVFTLSGNHDMYSGGVGYYWLLDQIKQKASFFCLRNKFWQFIGLDTGVNDYDPFNVDTSTPTLKATEFEWLEDKVTNSAGARTVIMSHHPLFSVYERINSQPVNEPLHRQFKDLLTRITAWYWAHEHNLVVYKKYLDIHARCVGHGAFPVAIGELGMVHADVPYFENILLGQDNGCYKHGYVIIELERHQARANYYECDSAGGKRQLYSEQLEQLP
jgi:Calcineurin-like phosphoesterase